MVRFVFGVSFLLFLWAAVTQAVPVNPNSPDGIAALYYVEFDALVDAWGYYVLTTSGEVWLVRPAPGTITCALYQAEIPVPLSEIRDWSFNCLITYDNQLWYYDRYGNWQTGPISCLQTPIPTENKTWGGVKGKYDGNK
jgi:hypothetical protein